MMRLSCWVLALFAVVATPNLTAHADTYSFLISTGSTSTTPGTTFTASGTFTGSAAGSTPPALNLTNVTGAAQGYDFTGVVPVGSNSNFTYDNLLFTDPSAFRVDTEGILLTLSSPIGESLAHVFQSGGGYEVNVINPNDPGDITPFVIDSNSFTISRAPSIPEPSTLALVGTGILGAIGAFRRKFAA